MSWEAEAIIGEVVLTDGFGNLVTNLPGASVDDASGVEIKGQKIPVVRTYGDLPSASLAALVNSDGRVEVAARDSSAAELLNADVGTRVRIPK